MDNNQQEEQLINYIHTPCRDCVFAKYESNKQIDCFLGRIDKYREANTNIVTGYDEEGKEFFVIDGRICLFHRTSQYMEKYPANLWSTMVDLETLIPYQVIIFIEKEHTLSDIKKSISSIQAQFVKPNFITFVNKQYISYSLEPEKFISPKELYYLLQDSKLHRFSLRNIYDDSLSDRAIIDLVLDHTKNYPYLFYVTFDAKFDIPEDFSNELNTLVLHKMLQICVSKPIDHINGMVVSRVAHLKFAGNSFGKALEDKIIETEENGERFIFESKDIFKCLSK